MKHQMYGDLDEAKLIEGLTGEKGIYKRRGEKEPEVWTLDYCVLELSRTSCFGIVVFRGLRIMWYCILWMNFAGVFD